MKTRLLAAAFAAVLALAGASVQGQEPVSTGIIKGVSPKNGTLTMRSDQTSGDLVFFGLAHANIFTNDGKPLTTTDLQPGQRVTLQYAVRDKVWYISKVILSEPRPAVALSPEGQQRAREASEGETRTPSATTPVEAPAPIERVQASGLRRTAP